jgi:hypothetical protein
LAGRLNELDPGERPWAVWDRELVERAAAEHHIPEALVSQLESYHRTRFDEILAALFPVNGGPDIDEYQLYRRVAQTIRGLARAGRAIIVGRGGVYATSDLAGGVHVRLVAPLERRVAHMSSLRNIPEKLAAAEVHRLDREREAFHRRYRRGESVLPEIFTITLNTALMDEDQQVECVLPLLRRAASVATTVSASQPMSIAAPAATMPETAHA